MKNSKRSKEPRSPVFQARVEIIVWRPRDEDRRALRLVEEFVETASPNRESMVRAAITDAKLKMSKFCDLAGLEFEVDGAEFWAAGSRNYGPFADEPEWVPAVDDLPPGPERDAAIRALTYLPQDIREQIEIYQS